MSARAAELDAHTVESDLYDRSTIARLRKSSHAWRKLDEEGGRLVPHFPALLDDLFCALFKYNVVRLPAEAGPPSGALNRTVVESVISGPAYAALRPQTLLDEARAGLGAVSIGESLLRAIKEDRTLTSGDLLDLWSLQREEDRTREAEEEADVAEELSGEGEESATGEAGEPAKPNPAARKARQALNRAAADARHAARVAAAERLQKQRHVEESLRRVGESLQRKTLGAAARAATQLDDLSEATSTWGLGLGAAGPRDAGRSIDLGRRLAANPKLKRLAQVFGRMREHALAVRKRVLDRADEELHQVGLHRSLDDLARLVPHELLALSHPLLRRDFQRRLLDGGLQTYALRGTDAHGHGPLVVCLDTSSSMAGDKEIWSKAVTLTFVEIARRQRRRCHVVCFADANALREFDMNPATPYEVELETTLDLAEHFSGGGTDFMAPLDAAAAKLETRALRRADIVLITDGECAVSEEWKDAFLQSKRRKNFSLYSILIDRGSARGETVVELSDRVSRVSELTEEGRELFSDMRTPRRTSSS